MLVGSIGLLASAFTPLLGTIWLAGSLFLVVGGVAVAAPAVINTIVDRAANTGAGNTAYSFFLFLGSAVGAPLAAALSGGGLPVVAGVGAACLLAGALLVRPDRPGARLEHRVT